MSVRTLLFALLATVLVGLTTVQWWLTRQQHQQLAEALSTTAFTVSRDTISVLIFEQSEDALLHDQSFEMRLDATPTQGSIVLSSPQFNHRITIPQSSMHKTLQASQQKQMAMVIIISALGILFALILAYRFARPLRQLQRAAQNVASGQFGQQQPLPSFAPRELKQTIEAFNAMSSNLQKLEHDNQQLRAQQQVDELADLARGLAHTMRNPLNTLGLGLEELSRVDLTDESRVQITAIVRRQIDTINHRLKLLLDVSATHELVQQIDVAKVLNEVMQEFPMVNFTAAISSSSITAQTQELMMVFHTVITNAIEASSEPVTVDIALKQHATQTIVTIRDYGQGIAPHIQTRLFQPHVSSKAHGAGLGLYLAKRVISGRYAGDITLAPADGDGTLATIVLYARRA